MTLTEPIQITKQITKVLDDLGIPYLVGGSLASSLHGIPRSTHDVDIIANIRQLHILPMVTKLEADFYIDEEMIRNAILHNASFNVIHLDTMFKVDIFILKHDPASQKEMARRERYQISEDPRQTLILATAEDTILHKLYWFQLGGGVSKRQWNDVLGVLQIQHKILDYKYLERGARQRGVVELLEKVLNEAEIGEFPE